MVTYLKKHKNHLSAIIATMLKTVYAENSKQFLWENSEQFYLMQKNRFYECSKQIWIYSKHDVQRANFINVETDFRNAEKRFNFCETQIWKSIQISHLNLENKISFGVLWENSEQFFQ